MEMKPLQGEPDISINMQKVKEFAELFHFTTSGISIFPLQNKPTLYSPLTSLAYGSSKT